MPSEFFGKGEVKAVIVRSDDGQIIGQRRNTRRYTHALVWDAVPGKSAAKVLTYHTREDLAEKRRNSTVSGFKPLPRVVATEIVEHA